jgi:hypothetical protein
VATILAMAMIYVSFCSTACLFGLCPYQQRESATRDFGHPSSSHHHDAPHHHDHGPGKSDCSTHHHPTFNVNAGGLTHFELTNTGQIPIGDLLVHPLDAPRFGSRSSALFDQGSPPAPKSPLSERLSVLRL